MSSSSKKHQHQQQPSRVVVIDSRDQFDQIVGSSPAVVIKFSADWCGPCKRIEPLYQSLSTDPTYGSVAFLYVDVVTDCGKELNDQYFVSALPTFIFARRERVLSSMTLKGADPNALRERLDALVTRTQ